MKRILETAIILIGTLGWWGFVYPELCVTEEIHEVSEDGEAQISCPWEEEDGDGILICKGNVRIKSKAMEYLFSIKEKTENKEDKSND